MKPLGLSQTQLIQGNVPGEPSWLRTVPQSWPFGWEKAWQLATLSGSIENESASLCY